MICKLLYKTIYHLYTRNYFSLLETDGRSSSSRTILPHCLRNVIANPYEVRLCQGAIKVAEATIVAKTDPMVNIHRVA